MDSLLYRYRNITVLMVAILGQITAVAWQFRSENDVPLLRVWAVSAVTPAASLIENLRHSATGFFADYFTIRAERGQNRRLQEEVNRLRLENQILQNTVSAARRVEALAGFRSVTPSKMLGARVIGATMGGTRSVLIDQGTTNGVRKGMAVVLPSGIVGKVLAAYPFASQVLSVTDAGFAAGVVTQKNHVFGVLKGVGSSTAQMEYVPTGQKVEAGELVYTSGQDRIFPQGMLVGKVVSVREGATFQEIFVAPSGAEAAPEEVFVIINPVHQDIPPVPPPDASPVFLGPAVPVPADAPDAPVSGRGTQADAIMDQYRQIGNAQNHKMGDGLPGSPPPNFNIKLVPGASGTLVAAPAASGARRVAPSVVGGSGAVSRPLPPANQP